MKSTLDATELIRPVELPIFKGGNSLKLEPTNTKDPKFSRIVRREYLYDGTYNPDVVPAPL